MIGKGRADRELNGDELFRLAGVAWKRQAADGNE